MDGRHVEEEEEAHQKEDHGAQADPDQDDLETTKERGGCSIM